MADLKEAIKKIREEIEKEEKAIKEQEDENAIRKAMEKKLAEDGTVDHDLNLKIFDTELKIKREKLVIEGKYEIYKPLLKETCKNLEGVQDIIDKEKKEYERLKEAYKDAIKPVNEFPTDPQETPETYREFNRLSAIAFKAYDAMEAERAKIEGKEKARDAAKDHLPAK
jgi:hypothetical protein